MAHSLTSALASAAGPFLRTLWRIARQLFHETTGALFIVFTAVGAASAWREWHKGSAPWLVAVPLGFAVLMVIFAVAAFRSARRVR